MSSDEPTPFLSIGSPGARQRFDEQEDPKKADLRVTLEARTRELHLLAEIVASLDPSHTLDEMLASLLRYAATISEASQCLVLLWKESEARFSIHTPSSSSCGDLTHLEPLQLEQQELQTLRTLSGQEQFLTLGAYVLDHVNPLKFMGYCRVYAVPFLRNGRLLGLLSCYYENDARTLSPEEQLLLRTLANQAAQTLGYYRLLDLLTHGPLIKGLFDLLLQPSEESEDTLRRYASMLGLDLEHPHCVALVEIEVDAAEEPGRSDMTSEASFHSQSRVERVAEQVRARFLDKFPGSLFYQQNHTLTGLIDLATASSGPHLKNWLLDQHLELSGHQGVHLFIGLSNPYRAIGDYRRGFAEAGQALQIGHKIHPEGGVIHISDVRIYSYLTAFPVPGELSDPYQEKIEQLARYDQRYGEENERLLETLEEYLTSDGNAAKAAITLGVHRNTIDQRLKRITHLTGIDVQSKKDPALRFDLQLALRVYKLRAQQVS